MLHQYSDMFTYPHPNRKHTHHHHHHTHRHHHHDHDHCHQPPPGLSPSMKGSAVLKVSAAVRGSPWLCRPTAAKASSTARSPAANRAIRLQHTSRAAQQEDRGSPCRCEVQPWPPLRPDESIRCTCSWTTVRWFFGAAFRGIPATTHNHRSRKPHPLLPHRAYVAPFHLAKSSLQSTWLWHTPAQENQAPTENKLVMRVTCRADVAVWRAV